MTRANGYGIELGFPSARTSIRARVKTQRCRRMRCLQTARCGRCVPAKPNSTRRARHRCLSPTPTCRSPAGGSGDTRSTRKRARVVTDCGMRWTILIAAACTIACAQARSLDPPATSSASAQDASPTLPPATAHVSARDAAQPASTGTAGALAGASNTAAQPASTATAGAPASASNTVAQPLYAESSDCARRVLRLGLTLVSTTVCFDSDAGPCWTEAPCRSSADCTVRPFGFCSGFERDGGYVEYAKCHYDECGTDADCAPGHACACNGGGLRVCVGGDCRRDADCKSPQHCIRTDTCGAGPFGAFKCTTDADQCRTNQDCIDNGLGNSCTRWEHDYFECIRITCD